MRNLTMMTDLYQLTMMQGYLLKDKQKKKSVFDVFYRKFDDGCDYCVMAGLEQAIEYIKNLHFAKEDIDYLNSLGIFGKEFLDYLANLRFTGDIAAVPEGTVVFPGEPLVRVTAPTMEAQLVETALLNIINHQTLIATKARKVVNAAQGDAIMEFGLRRAQGPDAGIYGARAAIIGGCVGTSNVLTGEMYGVPIKGTHAHSWVMHFDSELEAFRAYADIYPDGCLLLVDTYDTLKSGVPNAIKVFDELRAKGYEPVGIRLDSGDMTYLSKEARKMLDAAGYPNAKIFASGDLDEEVIWELKAQGARIDIWGVGTKLITSDRRPALGGVYKMSAEIMEDGTVIPKIKISDNVNKVTNPGIKKVYRIYDNRNNKALADLITLAHETIDESKPLSIFHPEQTWKRMLITDYHVKELLVPVFVNGECVYESPSLSEISKYAQEDFETFWSEYMRIKNPQYYKVDLSQELYDLKHSMLKEHKF
ncbi:MAG: nicotinate phosphoribosyltransferase [Eubacteriales bacterium]|nr:nicotinate phosphoribosyltransferase [Eubacteriales bacterium]